MILSAAIYGLGGGCGTHNAHVAFEQIAVAFQHVYTWFGDLMRNQLRYWVSEMRISKLTNNLAQRTNFIAASKFTVIGCDDHLNSLCSNLPFFFNSSCYCCSYAVFVLSLWREHKSWAAPSNYVICECYHVSCRQSLCCTYTMHIAHVARPDCQCQPVLYCSHTHRDTLRVEGR